MCDVISVIVTGAGAPGIAGTIFALRNNPDGMDLKIVAVDAKDDVVGKYLSDKFYKVPYPESREYLHVIKGIAVKENTRAIVPQTTREIMALSKCKEKFNALGINILVSNYESIKRANDKFLLLESARQIGVPYPSYHLVRSEEDFVRAVKLLGYPKEKVVIKPRISNGMRGLRILTEDSWDVQKFLNEKPDGVEITLEGILNILRKGRWPELLVTEYLEGVEYTADVFRNSLGIIAIPRLRESIRSGITFDARVELREDLIGYSKKLAEALALEYCFGFQFKLSEEGVPKLLECNPRIQGTMVASTFAGFNMIYHAVKGSLGYQVDVTGVRLKDRVQFKRYWGGSAIDDGNFVGRV